MERKEVSNCLELIKNIILNSNSWCVEAKIVAEKCFNTAIKNLEAWDKVKEEIKYHADNIKYTDAYRDGFEVSLKIIDKHLSEVMTMCESQVNKK